MQRGDSWAPSFLWTITFIELSKWKEKTTGTTGGGSRPPESVFQHSSVRLPVSSRAGGPL